MKSHLEIVSDKYSKVIAQLQAENLKLREALTGLNEEFKKLPHSFGYEYTHTKQVDTLLATPAQSLQDHDNEVIERCAVVAYDNCESPCTKDAIAIRDHILKLKGK